jgi:hypothetical protein
MQSLVVVLTYCERAFAHRISDRTKFMS